MKNLKLITILIITAIFSSCNNDDDKNTEATLAGNWKLIETSGTIAGTTDTFTPGTITWNFNVNEGLFTVINNNADENAQDVFDSGIYSYSFVQSPLANSICNKTIKLDDVDYGCFTITNTTLQINQGEADGLILKFIR